MPRNSFITEKKLHVFIADDDPDDISFFRLAMEEMSKDIKVTIAKDGFQLLEFLQVVVPDIIFLDINMPVMNGIDCLKNIRSEKKYDRVPVIIYSTTADMEQIETTYSIGANMYIQKPTKFNAIKNRLNNALSLSLSDLIPQPPREKYLVKFSGAE